MNKKNVLILGGCGFLGSNIVECLLESGYGITVIDGLLENTGGLEENLSPFISEIKFIHSKIEEVENLESLLNDCQTVIDAMGWTLHHEAIINPLYDLQLNLYSHVHFIQKIPRNSKITVFYLGSKVQYGNPPVEKICEDTPMMPLDIQGINKLAAENYYRVYSKFKNFNVISLRIPNCYGKNQVLGESDIGLIGNFIRDSLSNKTIDIFGEDRKRSVLFARDLSKLIIKLMDIEHHGFEAYNVPGQLISIYNLAKEIIRLTKQGDLICQSLPEEIKMIDMHSAIYLDEKLKSKISGFEYSDLSDSLAETIEYFKVEK